PELYPLSYGGKCNGHIFIYWT
ncbi:uncharacterized protein METZ01_LOCUS373338, partial [marine metagenome]